ncbi:MAG TPA: hypothetical protein VGN25_05965 [Solirubrobacteraceae bacterium]|nr:hypothetical protein [Solirubrobacteraceae bacterium]
MPIRGNYRRSRRAGVVGVMGVVGLLALAGSSSAQASTLPTLTVSATASTITVSGSPQAGAVNVVASATGVKEAGIILFQLKPGVKPAEVFAFLATKASGDPNTASKFGSIVFDAEAGPGAGSEAQTTLQPGEYLALEVAGEGPPKAHAAFTVAPSGAPVALPAAQATERTIDFGFKGPSTLKDGELVRFENEGFLVHMDFAFPVKSRAAAARAVKLLLAGKEKQTEKMIVGPPVGFAGPLSTGGFQQETITAKPGWYVQVCFMQTQDGRDHTRLGMERVIKIIK